VFASGNTTFVLVDAPTTIINWTPFEQTSGTTLDRVPAGREHGGVFARTVSE
jgi:hypothetical protein